MKPNQLERWREYLVAEIKRQHGMSANEAERAVTRWLNSVFPETSEDPNPEDP